MSNLKSLKYFKSLEEEFLVGEEEKFIPAFNIFINFFELLDIGR
jgi:hypothetical protein